MPKHTAPIYIPSKGRAHTVQQTMTINWMLSARANFYVVVEPQEVDAYARAMGGTKHILPLDLSYKDKYDSCDADGIEAIGSGPARNFAGDHSRDGGHVWHWVVDDNHQTFYRYHQNRKIRAGDTSIFYAMEDFCDRYTNIAMAGPTYEMFVPRKYKFPAYNLNRRIYSCNLIRNDVPFRWRGRYNEDTILSLDMLKAGWCTVLFNAFLAGKIATQVVSGGNTDEFYKAKGTRVKSDMLVHQHPDVARHIVRYGRDHHYVDYSGFKHGLIRKSDYAQRVAAAAADYSNLKIKKRR